MSVERVLNIFDNNSKATAVDEYVALAGQGKTDAAGGTRPLG